MNNTKNNKLFYPLTTNCQPKRMLTLAFLRPDPIHDPWMNRMTGKISTHPLCHVELFFESINQCFSVMWGEKAGFRVKNMSNPNYQLVSLAVSAKEYDQCLEFCNNTVQQGLTFDDCAMWRSMCTIGWCESHSHTKGKTFCSKIITEALQFAGIAEVESLHPACTTPSRLFQAVHLSRRMVCNSVPFKRQAMTVGASIPTLSTSLMALDMAGGNTMKPLRMGHSLLQPENTSSMVLPPVITIFPEKKHNRTTGEDSGLNIRPGNIFR